MRIAVITPAHDVSSDWMARCCESVKNQTIEATHIVVFDGNGPVETARMFDAQVIELPAKANNFGDTPRAIGSAFAISQGFDAIAWLDADNWFDPCHLQKMKELHERTWASVCTTGRNLYHINGELLGKCYEVDGSKFVDTNCFFITRPAFELASVWAQMHPEMHVFGDRVVWEHVRLWGLSHAHSTEATVAYTTTYAVHYRHFNVALPAGIKSQINCDWRESKPLRKLLSGASSSALDGTREEFCATNESPTEISEESKFGESVVNVTAFSKSTRIRKKKISKRCVVLVPVASHVEPACESGLRELEKRGYDVWRWRGYSAIDQGRNQMATDALAAGYDETLWIDSDVAFDPNDVEKMRNHELPVVAGIYPKKGKREFAINALPGTKEMIFGKAGGLTEIRYAATGFLLIQRRVYQEVQSRLGLEICNLAFGRATVPYFQPLVVKIPKNGSWYLGEDYAFSERVRRCGYKIMADTSIRLRHIGSYEYSWEDAGADVRRFGTYTYSMDRKIDTTK